MKRQTALILVLAILLYIAMPVAAANSSSAVQPRYTHIMDISAGMEVSFLGVANCRGALIAKTNTPVKIIIRLQELDGSNWMTIKKWEFTDSGSVSGTGDYAIYSGRSYRVHVTGYVYDANGNILESASVSRYMDY